MYSLLSDIFTYNLIPHSSNSIYKFRSPPQRLLQLERLPYLYLFRVHAYDLIITCFGRFSTVISLPTPEEYISNTCYTILIKPAITSDPDTKVHYDRQVIIQDKYLFNSSSFV